MQRSAQRRIGPRHRLGREQRREVGADFAVEPGLQPRPQPLARGAVEELAVEHLHPRPQRVAARRSRAIGDTVPVHAGDRRSARRHRGGGFQHARRGAASPRASARRAARSTSFFSSPTGERVGDEAEAFDVADIVALDDDLAAPGDGGEQFLALVRLEPAHQLRGAAIDEAGRSGVRAARRTACPRPPALAPASAGVSFTQSDRAAI